MTAGSGLFSKQRAKVNSLLKAGGLSGEVADLRNDIAKEMQPMAAFTVDEFTNLAAATTSGLKVATATVAAAVVLTTTDLLLSGVLGHPRQVTFTTAGGTPAHAPASVAVEGTDVDGRFQTETINLAQTAATVSTTKAYKTVTKVSYPAADGVSATVAIGWAAPVGLSRAIKARAGLTEPLKEILNGAEIAPATGTFTAAATNPPYGLYTPATPGNGTNDYAIFFEFDATV